MGLALTLWINLEQALKGREPGAALLLQLGIQETEEFRRVLENVAMERPDPSSTQEPKAGLMLAECELLVSVLKYRIAKMRLLSESAREADRPAALQQLNDAEALVHQLNSFMTIQVVQANKGPRSAA